MKKVSPSTVTLVISCGCVSAAEQLLHMAVDHTGVRKDSTLYQCLDHLEERMNHQSRTRPIVVHAATIEDGGEATKITHLLETMGFESVELSVVTGGWTFYPPVSEDAELVSCPR